MTGVERERARLILRIIGSGGVARLWALARVLERMKRGANA